MEQSDFAEAEKLFLKALECNPDDANIYVHRGILEMQSKFNFEKAADLMGKICSKILYSLNQLLLFTQRKLLKWMTNVSLLMKCLERSMFS